MSGKYMKIRRVTIPMITMVLIASTLFGVSACSPKETTTMLQQNSEIEIEYAIPEYGYTSSGEEESITLLPWIELASLESHPELRSAFEELLEITTNEAGEKYGILYTNEEGKNDQNNTLLNALGNLIFAQTIKANDDKSAAIEQIANDNYTDIDEDTNQSMTAVVNAYFELLPDLTDGEFNGGESISRAQAMTLVMRAITPVNEDQKPEGNADFTKAVGESQYTDFAAEMNDMVFVSTDNGLTNKNFNTAMSRGEYIYMLTQTLFGDDYAVRLKNQMLEDESLNNDGLTTVADAGDITFSEAIKNPENGVPTDMYTVLSRAVALGFIDEDNLNWDEAITKADAIDLFIDAATVSYSTSEFITASNGREQSVTDEGLTARESVQADGDYYHNQGYDIDSWTAEAQAHGADDVLGAWWIYYYGGPISGNTERSYAVNQRTGITIVAGPDTYFYGGPGDSYQQPFYGGPNTIPGEKYPEDDTNMRRNIGEPEEYLRAE